MRTTVDCFIVKEVLSLDHVIKTQEVIILLGGEYNNINKGIGTIQSFFWSFSSVFLEVIKLERAA